VARDQEGLTPPQNVEASGGFGAAVTVRYGAGTKITKATKVTKANRFLFLETTRP
jgi:hypothetical protein